MFYYVIEHGVERFGRRKHPPADAGPRPQPAPGGMAGHVPHAPRDGE
jgi:hypothetical protein